MADPAAVRAQLEERLQLLTRQVDKIEQDLRKAQNPDWQERAIETENDEVLERLDAQSLAEVRQIHAALDRIEDGTYGTCSSCGEPISNKRLEAVPYAVTCIVCAS